MCADVAAEGEDCGEVYLDYLMWETDVNNRSIAVFL